ncbi:chaperonin GroEL [Candidatus Woesearchaeota archaeon]|nr:chaperonin GroEL [Candidatus Woesearchaeota archaeon]
MNKLDFGTDAREKLAMGADKLAQAVTATLGPGGREVIIQTQWGSPTVTKDGVTVAKAIELEDALENLGATLLKEAAIKTNDTAGDGTTTATLLAQSMYRAGLKAIESENVNPVYLRRGIEQAVRAIGEQLSSLKRDVRDAEEIRNVALISSNHDESIADIISIAISGGTLRKGEEDAAEYQGVGPNGVITVKEGKTSDTSLEFVEGYEFDRGFRSPYFITNPERLSAELPAPHIVLYDGKMGLPEVVKVLEEGMKSDPRPFLFIAEDFDEQALATLVLNTLKGHIRAAAVKAPGFGDRRKALLEDIAIATGGKVISSEAGLYLEKMTSAAVLECLGSADEVTVGKDATTILGARAAPGAVESRVRLLEKESEATASDYDKEKLQERIAKLAGKVAVINIGAYTEMEMKERKYRVEDAMNATRAASKEGIVPGGGVAYLRLAQGLEERIAAEKDPSTKKGVQLVADALRQPAYHIAKNAGADADAVLKRLSAGKEAFGYDALRQEYGDMYTLGVIDPALVVRSAIENAASVAVHLLNAECAVTVIPEKKDEPAHEE